MLKHIFANISAQGGLFFKPIFALKPWVQDGHFVYKPSKIFFLILSVNVKNHLKNPKLRENWTWLGKKAFHLGICDP